MLLMNNWQILAPLKFGATTTTENLVRANDIKIKTIKCFVTHNDLAQYVGTTKREYPFTPCNVAIGQVIETFKDSNYIKKGSKVYLAPTFANQNETGYLRDFIVASQEDVYVLPDVVNENDALYLNHLSLALTVVDELQIEKGNHVAIIGGSYLANVIAQLVMYYQSVPILVDTVDKNLELAHKTNVYYTLTGDKNLESEVLSITGGRKCSKVIYVNDSSLSVDVIDKVSANNAVVAFTGISPTKTKLSCNLAFDKEINVKFIKNGDKNIGASINLLAQKAIDLSYFNLPIYKFEYAPKHFENAISKLEEKQNAEFIIDML